MKESRRLEIEIVRDRGREKKRGKVGGGKRATAASLRWRKNWGDRRWTSEKKREEVRGPRERR